MKPKKKKIQKINLKKKKHADQFFNSLPKLHNFYFKNRKLFKSNYNLFEYNSNKNFLQKNNFIGLKSLESNYLSLNCLISCLKFFKRFFVYQFNIFNFKYNIKVFPDFWLTGKPKEVRMGKGKGSISKKIYLIKKGCMIFEFFCYKNSYYFFISLIKKCSLKLPVKNNLVYEYW